MSGGAPASRWPLRLWLAAVLLLVLGVAVVGTAWLVKAALSGSASLGDRTARAAIAVANFPALARQVLGQLTDRAERDPTPLLLRREQVEQPHWQRRFPQPADPGYLLFAGVDAKARQSIVSLVRVADGAELARWQPDWPAILQRSTLGPYSLPDMVRRARALHPMLLPGGDVVFIVDSGIGEGAMVRMAACSAQPLWVLDGRFHHSVQPDGEGGFWAPASGNDAFAGNPWLAARVRDDLLVRVAADGRVMARHSFGRALIDSGLQALMLGMHGLTLHDDPLHVNEIVAAGTTTAHWQRGDLLVSSRHTSTVFLFRPSTGRIVWHRTGPWLNQHSVDFVGDHSIVVFNNNVVSGAPADQPFLTPGDSNRVVMWDLGTQALTEPWAPLLAAARPATMTEGRVQLLPDGGLFIEESNQGRLLRFTRDGLLWSRVNDYDAQRIGVLSWSRYLTAEEAASPLAALAARPCR